MRKFLLPLFLWISPFLLFFTLVTACSESEKKVASGYTEEQNAWDIRDTVAYLKLLKTWEPEIPVDSAKVNMDGGDQFWYDIVFLSAPKPSFAYTEVGADSAACTVNRYSDENGIRLTVNLDSSRELYTQILQRDSMFAVVVDRLDKTYGSGDPDEACGEDSVAFVEQCERSKGTVVDQLKRDCNELHLVCTQEIMAKKTADEFLDSTAADLKARCADALGISLKDMGNGVMDGKVPWRYLNPEIDYGEVVDERDGQVYKTVVIDTLVWMSENLNYADSDLTPSLLGKNWCYNNEPDSCVKYGRLYTWGAAIDSVALANDPENPRECGDSLLCTDLKYIRGLCMEGWHLPSSAELHTLDDIASTGTPKIAIVDENTEDPTYGPITLRSAYLWESGIDTYGLSLLPAGYYLFDSGEFEDLGSASFFWSLDYAENYAWMYTMYNEKFTFNTHVTINEKYKFAISIRCVKNL
ncbi:FISUMP domain-containing protein [Fibrobacter sp. UBA4309]|uniref:FISUMP domain-containing protein n=1 Tax=Fibrobacter sp. UBA4309 TaxID=1946537 RepID=UPI0025C6BF3A|nr:FISUMP domain-containing protein [Fibrobacter sp. UBA4309]